MRRSGISILTFLVISLLFIGFLSSNAYAVLQDEYADSIRYTNHSVIRIDGDGDFTSANGVVGGSGTESDPYRISGLMPLETVMQSTYPTQTHISGLKIAWWKMQNLDLEPPM